MQRDFLTWVRFAVQEIRDGGKTQESLSRAYRFLIEAIRFTPLDDEHRAARSSLFRMLNWVRADLRKAVA